MIGTRATQAGVTFVATLLAFGPGAPRPEVTIGADRQVAIAAENAGAELAALHDRLQDALEIARRAAAAVVSGDDDPGPLLREASDALSAAVPAVERSMAAVEALAIARRARDPGTEAVANGTEGALIRSVAAQLIDVTDAADLFAEMRRRAANVPEALDDALGALRSDDLTEAAAGVAAARADLDAVAGWDVDFVTLPVWVETSDAVVDAVERLIAAVAAGDAAGAELAAADFSELGPDASDADRALQIAISEGAATVVSPPMARLTGAIDAVQAQRADVGALLAEDRR